MRATTLTLTMLLLSTACTPRADVLWAPGEEHVYAFKIHRAVRSANARAPILNVRVHANLRVVPQTPVQGRQRLDLTLREIKVFGENGEQHTADLQRNCQIELQGDTVTGLYADPKTGPVAVALLRTLGSVLQLSRPASQGMVRYEATEQDAIGRYVASYDRTTRGAVRRTKLRYEAAPGHAKAPEVTRSTLSLNLHEGAITSAEFQEAITVASPEGTKLSYTTKLYLTLQRKTDAR